MNETNLIQYMDMGAQEPSMGLYAFISIILFGSVLVFVGIFVYNFIKAAKYGTANFEEIEGSKVSETKNSIKSIKKSQTKVCVYCGKQNESDSKFCNNCGKRMP